MITQKYILLILISTISLFAKSQDYCSFIQEIQNYQDYVKLMYDGKYDVIDSKTFNIDTYMSLFDSVKIEKGYAIGVYYFDNLFDGNPYIYALNDSQKLDEKNRESLFRFLNKNEIKAANHIVPKDSENGFLQYLFFCEMGEQYALKWHSNYNQKFIICTKEKLDEVINEFKKSNQAQKGENETEMPAFGVDLQALSKFAQVNPAVEIELTNEFCTITWIEDRTHRGIYRCKYMINRQYPYKIEKISEEQLLEITIGFLY